MFRQNISAYCVRSVKDVDTPIINLMCNTGNRNKIIINIQYVCFACLFKIVLATGFEKLTLYSHKMITNISSLCFTGTWLCEDFAVCLDGFTLIRFDRDTERTGKSM